MMRRGLLISLLFWQQIILLTTLGTAVGLAGKGLRKAGATSAPAVTAAKAPVAIPTCPPGAKVFMGNLPFEATEKDVERLLEMVSIPTSKWTKINLAMGSKTKRPLGWLLIEFKDPETARMCVDATDGIEFLGRTINVNIKDPPPEKRTPNQDHMIYLSNLDYSLTEIELFNMCEDLVGQGLVISVCIPLDKNRGGVPRGFAHVEFKDPSAVQLAITQLTGVEVFDRLLKAEKMTKPALKKKTDDKSAELSEPDL